MQSSTSPRHKVSGRSLTYQMVMSMTGRSWNWYFLFHECWMRCSHQKQSSTRARHKVRVRSHVYWYLSMTNVKWDVPIECKVVLVLDRKSEDVPWHTKWWCPWLEGHEIGTFTSTNVEWDVPIECKVVLVPDIKSVDVPWHTKWWCLWLEGHVNWYFLFDECRMRCSHRIQSRRIEYQMVIYMTMTEKSVSHTYLTTSGMCRMRCSIKMVITMTWKGI